MQRLERRGAERHHHRAENKQSNSALKWDLFEDRIRVPGRSATSKRERYSHTPSIMLEALLNPKPVAKGNGARQAQRGDDGDRPGWREK